ncbi:MAG: hypothetical protein JKY42_04190 [Flavobacteriales bacterium]|nr:hypothetical protein [Flavobacteriales bacterium]
MSRIISKTLGTLALFGAFSVVGFSQAKFEKKFHFNDNEYYDRGNDMIQTSDGGYLVVGRTVRFHSGGVEAYLVKLSSIGDTVWTKTYGGNGSEEALSVVECKDGGYTFCGYSNSNTNGAIDVYVVHTDAQGKEIWSYTYGGEAIDRGFDIQQTADGGYIISGESYSFGSGGVNAYLVKLDKDGTELWYRSFGGNGIQEGNAVIETADGGFVITGATNNFGPGDKDVYLFKVSSKGGQEWVCSFGGTGSEEGKSLIQTADGGYLVAGYTNSVGKGGDDVYVVKTDEFGQVVWEKNFGGEYDEQASTIFPTDDGGCVITGYTNSKGAGGVDVYLLRLNSSGELILEKTFGSRSDEKGKSVVQCKDGGFAITGQSISSSGDYSKEKNKEIYVIKTDIKGDSTPTE